MSRSTNLPVPVGQAYEARRERVRPSETRTAGAFDAHLLGQDGRRRGLKAGAPAIEAARSAYLDTEWSGRSDRRPRPGVITKTEI